VASDISAHVNTDQTTIVDPNGRLQSLPEIDFRDVPDFPKEPKF
jgi:hypothetical protein